MTLEQFIKFLLDPVGCGAAVWGTIALVDKMVTLPPALKFYGAMVLALAWPLAAYGVELALHWVTFSYDGLFLALAVAYMVSQTIHRNTAGS